MMRFLMVSALLLLPGVVQAATAKVEVTRFHLLAPPTPPLTGSSIKVEPADPAAAATLQFGALAASAHAELAKVGLSMAAADQPGAYVAKIALSATSEQVRKRSAFSVGIGGGTGGRNGGIGGGASFPIGGGLKSVTAAQMTLQIRRSSDNTIVWEGRASSIAPGIDPISAAPVLLQALLKGFPGANGKAETVKVKTNP